MSARIQLDVTAQISDVINSETVAPNPVILGLRCEMAVAVVPIGGSGRQLRGSRKHKSDITRCGRGASLTTSS